MVVTKSMAFHDHVEKYWICPDVIAPCFVIRVVLFGSRKYGFHDRDVDLPWKTEKQISVVALRGGIHLSEKAWFFTSALWFGHSANISVYAYCCSSWRHTLPSQVWFFAHILKFQQICCAALVSLCAEWQPKQRLK